MSLWFTKRKDGGPESKVTGYTLYENKRWFTIVLLRFDNGTRDAFHDHAFDSVSWILRGRLVERFLNGTSYEHVRSLRPIRTATSDFHQVRSVGTTWVFSLRGPWKQTWQEYLPAENRFRTLAQGRVEVR